MAIQITVPDPTEQIIKKLRRECARMRVQRNEALAEADRLRNEVEGLRAVVAAVAKRAELPTAEEIDAELAASSS